jgi:hypothetical protein
MSSPSEDVSGAMAWLNEVFHLFIPTLPLTGLWRRFTGLWELLVRGPLPPPETPLPWTIDVEGPWGDLFSGAAVQLDNIQILARSKEPFTPPNKKRLRSPKKAAPKPKKRRQK